MNDTSLGAVEYLCVFWTGFLASVTFFWRYVVNASVPEPYLDEVFHIPQAQQYCLNRFDVWDPKLTTPPGLYIFSRLAHGLHVSCDINGLRGANVLFLLFGIYPAAFLLRTSYSSKLDRKTAFHIQARHIITDIHTAVNIALFPPLWFFTALYYTDVGSTAIVLWLLALVHGRSVTVGNIAHLIVAAISLLCLLWSMTNGRIFTAGGIILLDLCLAGLVRQSYGPVSTPSLSSNEISTPLWLPYALGILALSFRQTNVFWAAVFPVGIRVLIRFPRNLKDDGTWSALLPKDLREEPRIANLDINEARAVDYVRTCASVVVAVLASLVGRLKRREWFNTFRYINDLFTPYLLIMSTFVAFIIWNGGVVLGDKSNHIATIHFPQLLYLSAYIAFFSLPLVYPYVLATLHALVPMPPLPRFIRLYQPHLPARRVSSLLIVLTFLMIILLAIHFNTIVHPFTLADNRHYVFYVFRILVLRHWAIKYAAAPVYLICGWFLLRTLGGPSGSQTLGQRTSEAVEPGHPVKEQGHADPMQASTRYRANAKQQQVKKKQGKVASGDRRSLKVEKANAPSSQPSATTGNVLIWFATSALCLISAPLVEPRYFILPWIMWRVQVPLIQETGDSITTATDSQNYAAMADDSGIWAMLKSTDHRLWLETLWFLLINAATGSLFLYRGFEWPQEPGKTQRFLW